MDKNILRHKMKVLRTNISTKEKEKEDNIIFEKVINSKFYKDARTIMIYVSFGHEVDTVRIINHGLANNKFMCVPKVINKKEGMKAIRIEGLEELKPGTLGILEPKDLDKEVTAKEIDLFLIPGLAFDKNGGRIGYGAGYYDRFLANSTIDSVKIGLAYSFQIIEEVPMSKTDITMDNIISGMYTK